MKFKEIEFKYDADKVSMNEFIELIGSYNTDRKKLVSSHDDYFTEPSGNFIRYRYTDGRGELTIKRKLSTKDNNERIEVNLPTNGDNFKTVEAFVNLLGYKHNFGIYKTCRIFWVDNVVIAYYIVYDKEMHEKRRFIEIEANEDHTWASEADAFEAIIRWEGVLAPLGINNKNRLKKSLFEMFHK